MKRRKRLPPGQVIQIEGNWCASLPAIASFVFEEQGYCFAWLDNETVVIKDSRDCVEKWVADWNYMKDQPELQIPDGAGTIGGRSLVCGGFGTPMANGRWCLTFPQAAAIFLMEQGLGYVELETNLLTEVDSFAAMWKYFILWENTYNSPDAAGIPQRTPPPILPEKAPMPRTKRAVSSSADTEIERAFADGSCRFALDQLIRAHGWRIERRETGREPVWRKRGRCYPESCVVRSLPDREVADALLLETFYFDERLKGAGA